jgi:hypothetical protein
MNSENYTERTVSAFAAVLSKNLLKFADVGQNASAKRAILDAWGLTGSEL